MHPGLSGGSANSPAYAGLATIGGLICAFLGTPQFYERTLGWVLGFTTSHYGYGWDEIITYGWFAASALLVFCFSKWLIFTALRFGEAAWAKRSF